jgi:hypothetical protein
VNQGVDEASGSSSNAAAIQDKREALKIKRYEEMFKKQEELEAKKLKKREMKE